MKWPPLALLLALSTSVFGQMTRYGTVIEDDDVWISDSNDPYIAVALFFAGVYVIYKFLQTRNKYSDAANYNFAFLIGIALMGIIMAW